MDSKVCHYFTSQTPTSTLLGRFQNRHALLLHANYEINLLDIFQYSSVQAKWTQAFHNDELNISMILHQPFLLSILNTNGIKWYDLVY